MVRRVREAGGVTHVRIRIGSSPVHPASSLRPFLTRLERGHPEFSFDVVYFDESEDASATLSAMGEDGPFDCVAGICASEARMRECRFLRLADMPVRLAVPLHNRLATREVIELEDLAGECVAHTRASDSGVIDGVCRALQNSGAGIRIVELPMLFYNDRVFNDAVKDNMLLITTDVWADLHPGLVTLPVRWDETIPYGLTYSLNPNDDVMSFVDALAHGA